VTSLGTELPVTRLAETSAWPSIGKTGLRSGHSTNLEYITQSTNWGVSHFEIAQHSPDSGEQSDNG
jgi:hypothetical protein